MSLRAVQAVYDFALDAVGVTVGRYRVGLFLTVYSVVLGTYGCSRDGWAGLFWPLFVVPLVFYGLFSTRRRMRQDDADQEAGRYRSVNARALASREDLWSSAILWTVAAALFGFLTKDWAFQACTAGNFFLLDVHACLMVRDRDRDRFALPSFSPAAGSAV